MNCTQAVEYLSAKLDGELSPEEAAELRAHLAECPECARLAEAMQGLDEKVAALREPAPEGLKKGVLYRIDQATGKARTPKRRWFGPGTVMGAVAAVLVLLVGVGVIPLRPQRSAAAPAATAAPETAADTAVIAGNKPDPMLLIPSEPLRTEAPGADWEGRSENEPAETAWSYMRTPETAAAEAAPETADKSDNYYLSGGDSEGRREPNPLREETRALCADRSRAEDRLLLLYTEFDAESFLALLETEEPKLYELLADAPRREEDGLCILDTSCGTALAVHEWLLANLPRSEDMDASVMEAETALMIRMAQLDPDSESLYRIITWAPRAQPVQWPGSWPEGWAVRLRTEENWALFFPEEDYAPSGEKPACIAFLLPEAD